MAEMNRLIRFILFVYWKIIFFKKIILKKINYFLIFDNIIKNKLENNFQLYHEK